MTDSELIMQQANDAVDLVKRLRTWESGSANRNLQSYAQIFSLAVDRIEELEKEAKKWEMVIDCLRNGTVADLIDRVGEFKEIKL